MPAHLYVLRREQPGDRPGGVPRHADRVEAREPLPFPDHARVPPRRRRLREHVRHAAAVRRPAKLAQLPGHVRESLRRHAVERHAPQVPLPRPVRGEREPAPVRRPGGGARRGLDPSGRPLPRVTDGIHVHGGPPLTRLRLQQRLGHFNRRPTPVRRNRHAPHAFDRERQFRRPASDRGLRAQRRKLHVRCEKENQRGGIFARWGGCGHEVAI